MPRIYGLTRENKATIKKLLIYGRSEISSKEELEKCSIGSPVSYVTKSEKFKDGGFLYKFRNNYFIYLTRDFKHKIRVRYTNINKMYVGNVYKTVGDVVSISPSNQPVTKYPTYIGDIIVNYAGSNQKSRRYTCTCRYERMVKWYNFFVLHKPLEEVSQQ